MVNICAVETLTQIKRIGMTKISDTTRIQELNAEYLKEKELLNQAETEFWEDKTHYARVIPERASKHTSTVYSCKIFIKDGNYTVDECFTKRYFLLKNYLEMYNYQRGVK